MKRGKSMAKTLTRSKNIDRNKYLLELGRMICSQKPKGKGLGISSASKSKGGESDA